MTWVRATCVHCGVSETWRPAETAEALQRHGMLKRSAADDVGLLWELLAATAPRLRCTHCEQEGLQVVRLAHRPVAGDAGQSNHDDDFSAWPEARACRGCRQPIPAERLELFPHEVLCAACKDAAAASPELSEDDFCPRCGDRLQVRLSQGRTANYQLTCPSCRYR